jgi:hypothetical protein
MKVDSRIVRAALVALLAAGAGWALLNRDELDLSALETTVQALEMWAPAANQHQKSATIRAGVPRRST